MPSTESPSNDHWPNLKTRPQSHDAEKAVLGAMMLSEDALDQMLEALKAEDFYSKGHRLIYKALGVMSSQGEPVDAITLADYLDRENNLESVGGRSKISELVLDVPSIAVVDHYAKIVREKSHLRSIYDSTIKIQEAIFERGEVDPVLEIAESEIQRVSEKRIRSNDSKISDIMTKVVEDFEERKLGKEINTGIPTSYYKLNELLGGFRGGEMIIVAARPSMGKTSLALNLIHDVAVSQQQPIVFFSLEMGNKQICNNLICRDSEIELSRWMTQHSTLDQNEQTRLASSFNRLAGSPIIIDDDPYLTPSILHAKLRRYKKDQELSAVFIDYLQLMNSPDYQKENRAQEISHISRSIKALSREMNVPIVALAQLNRSVEGRSSKRPTMSDLRESGSIEQDADAIILLHRPDYYDEDDRPGEADLIVAKHRNGPTGTAVLNYARARYRFENMPE